MKNIDWIKSLDAEQMAKWALDESCSKCTYNARDCGHIPCKDGVAEWLNSEHEEPLKPCPFCGSEDVEVNGVYDMEIARIIGYEVKCRNCGSNTGKADTRETAIEHWNERWSE